MDKMFLIRIKVYDMFNPVPVTVNYHKRETLLSFPILIFLRYILVGESLWNHFPTLDFEII